MQKTFDIGIIGAGPAGYTAAFHARKQGLSVVLFEKDKVGGVCLNRGCIPTKTILHCAEVYEEMNCASDLGIQVDNVKVDFAKVLERKEKTVEKIRKGLELALKNSGTIVINSEAHILNNKQIKTNGEIYDCKKIIVATGSQPRSLKGMEFDHKFILNSDDILNLENLPKSIAIIGSGAIGAEWARIFAAFGVEVSIIEVAERLLPLADVEVSKRLERIFKTKKIKMHLKSCVEKIEDKKVYLSTGETLEPEKVLIAVGRRPRNEDKSDGIAYIGDVAGSIQLAHFAIKQAIAEVSGIAFDKNLVPSVVYGCPEIAWVGKREQDLQEGSYQKAMILVSALGKSHCDNCSEGFIKILSQNNKIVGAHIVSKEASALIHQILIAIQNDISVSKLREVCFAHPTYSEGIFECLFKLD